MPGALAKTQRRRPTLYRQEIMNEILMKLSMGETLNEICKENDKPSTATVYKWLRETPGLREQWEIAKEQKSHHLMEEALDLARTLKPEMKAGKVILEVPLNRSRAVDIRIKALMEMAARLNPKAYGPRNQANNVIPIQIVTNMNLGQDGPPADGIGENIYEVKAPRKITIDG